MDKTKFVMGDKVEIINSADGFHDGLHGTVRDYNIEENVGKKNVYCYLVRLRGQMLL